MKTLARFLLVLLVSFGCSPELLDDCNVNADCAKGVCEQGYCVPRSDGAGAGGEGGQASHGDAANAGGSAGGGTRPDASRPDAAPLDGARPDAAVSDATGAGGTLPPDAIVVAPDALPDAATAARDAMVVIVPDAADGQAPDAAPPVDVGAPADAGEPGVVGACGDNVSHLPLYAPDGHPCVTLETTALWAFLNAYSAEGGGNRHINEGMDDNLGQGAIRYIPSPFDTAISFFGSNDLWQGASVPSAVRNTAPMSIELWVRLPENSAGGAVLSNIDDCRFSDVTAGWQVGFEAQPNPRAFIPSLEFWDGVDPAIGGATFVSFEDGIVLAPSVWHHVAYVFEGAGQVAERVFVWADGIPMGEVLMMNFGPRNGAAWLHLGTRANCVVEAIKADVDAIRILNRALTLDELMAAPMPMEPMDPGVPPR